MFLFGGLISSALRFSARLFLFSPSTAAILKTDYAIDQAFLLALISEPIKRSLRSHFVDLAEKNGGRFEGLLKGNLFVSDNVKVHVLRQYLKKR